MVSVSRLGEDPERISARAISACVFRPRPQTVVAGSHDTAPNSYGYGTVDVRRDKATGPTETQLVSWATLFAIAMNPEQTVAHGSDRSREWYMPIFESAGAWVPGTAQAGPAGPQGSATIWHPNDMAGIQNGDTLIATIHTHPTNPNFSTNDLKQADDEGKPMVLIAIPGRSTPGIPAPTPVLKIYYPLGDEGSHSPPLLGRFHRAALRHSFPRTPRPEPILMLDSTMQNGEWHEIRR